MDECNAPVASGHQQPKELESPQERPQELEGAVESPAHGLRGSAASDCANGNGGGPVDANSNGHEQQQQQPGQVEEWLTTAQAGNAEAADEQDEALIGTGAGLAAEGGPTPEPAVTPTLPAGPPPMTRTDLALPVVEPCPRPGPAPDEPAAMPAAAAAAAPPPPPLAAAGVRPPAAAPPTASVPGFPKAGPATTTDTTGTSASLAHEPLPQRHPVPHFVAPSSYLRPLAINRSAMAAAAPEPTPPPTVHDKEQIQGLSNIREFLKVRCGYDVFPLSFRLIVLDTDLLIKKSLNIMIQNSIVSAPLWDSRTSTFAGLLTATDYINVIQYYCQFPDEMSKLDQFRLSSLRDIEKAIGAFPIETVSVNPQTPLFDAIEQMLRTRARRIPLVDIDDETGKEWVVSVITQYRILKFIAVNNEHNTVLLKRTVRELNIGTYNNVGTTLMSSSVLDVIHKMVQRNISCVPVVDEDNRVLNVFEAVDIIPCIRGGVYEELNGTVGDALCKRPDDSPGIYTCSEHDRLGAIFDTIRKSRVHRLIVVDDDNKLRGIISLSDILQWVLLAEI